MKTDRTVGGVEYVAHDNRMSAVLLEEDGRRAVVEFYAEKDGASHRSLGWKVVRITLETRDKDAMSQQVWMARAIYSTSVPPVDKGESWIYYLIYQRAEKFLKALKENT